MIGAPDQLLYCFRHTHNNDWRQRFFGSGNGTTRFDRRLFTVLPLSNWIGSGLLCTMFSSSRIIHVWHRQRVNSTLYAISACISVWMMVWRTWRAIDDVDGELYRYVCCDIVGWVYGSYENRYEDGRREGLAKQCTFIWWYPIYTNQQHPTKPTSDGVAKTVSSRIHTLHPYNVTIITNAIYYSKGCMRDELEPFRKSREAYTSNIIMYGLVIVDQVSELEWG